MGRPLLIAELGSGGMADVFLAMRRGIGGFAKLVVIKELRTSDLGEDVADLFHDEARVCARLNHPNVVQTIQAEVDGDRYRLEMEYLDGQPLHRVVNRARKFGRAIPVGVGVSIVRSVLGGLHYAHDLTDFDGSPLDVVHRDVSPQNIFITYDGCVKLVDFGIAKAARRIAVTHVGMLKGKARYMAPEQVGGHIDRRVDVFAAGIVLWQLLAGRSYWGDLDDLSVCQALARRELPPPPRTVNPDVPEALDAVCARALAWDPEDRFATAQEFLHALEDCMPPERNVEQWLSEFTSELFEDVRRALRVEIEKAVQRALEAPPEEPTQLLPLNLTASGSHTGPIPSHTRSRSKRIEIGQPILEATAEHVSAEYVSAEVERAPSSHPSRSARRVGATGVDTLHAAPGPFEAHSWERSPAPRQEPSSAFWTWMFVLAAATLLFACVVLAFLVVRR